MDVTCNRCGAEYEFEETLISDRGTTVKCTNCGHLFKVFHPRTPFDKSLETKPWLIRKTNGLIEPLESLGELTRLISEGHYLEDDEISRTSQAWKRLGDIAELESYFEIFRRKSDRPESKSDAKAPEVEKSVAGTTPYRLPSGVRSSDVLARPDGPPPSFARKKEGKEATQQPRRRAETINVWSTPPLQRSEESQNRVTAESNESSPEGRGRQRKAVRVLQTGVDKQAEEVGTNGTVSRPADERDSDKPTMKFQASAVSEDADKSVDEKKPIAPTTALKSEKPETEPAAKTVSRAMNQPLKGNSKVSMRRVGRGRMTILAIIIFAIIAVGVWISWTTRVRQSSKNTTTDLLHSKAQIASIRKAAAVLARYRLTEFERFTAKVTKAYGNKPQNKSLAIGLSRINAVWAQALRFKLFEQRFFKHSPDQSETANTDYLESQVMLYSDRAKLHAEEAMRMDPSDPDAQIALSDALRLTGILTTARRVLDDVRSDPRRPTVEFLRVSALLAIAESEGDYSKGLELAKQAVAEDPACFRTRFLLAYCSLAANETKDARVQIERILKKDSRHPEALALASLLDSSENQSAAEPEYSLDEITKKPVPTISKKPAPTVAKKPTPTVAKKSVTAPRSEKGASAKSEKSNKTVDPRLYKVYVELGEEMLEHGNVARAEKMFMSALEIRPDAPRAESGLGFVDLGKGRVNSALKHFRNAAKQHHAEAYIGLGDAFRQIGRDREALSAYENYVRLQPQGKAISVTKRKIDQLRKHLSK